MHRDLRRGDDPASPQREVGTFGLRGRRTPATEPDPPERSESSRPSLDFPDILIRPATAADFDVLVDLDLASARHHAGLDPSHLQVPEREPVAAFLGRRLANPDRRMLVAIVDGGVVGAVDVTMTDQPDPGSIYRSIPTADLGITVAEGWRNRGIGRALMAAAELDARARGARQVILDLHAANDGAERLYQRLGYEVYGLLMRRDLYPATDDEPTGAA